MYDNAHQPVLDGMISLALIQDRYKTREAVFLACHGVARVCREELQWRISTVEVDTVAIELAKRWGIRS